MKEEEISEQFPPFDNYMDMFKPRFRTPYNYVPKPDDNEFPDPVSMTVPDQTMTVSELLYRAVHGMPLSVSDYSSRALYDDTSDFDTYDPLEDGDTDLVDYWQASRVEAATQLEIQRQRQERFEADKRSKAPAVASDIATTATDAVTAQDTH